MPAKTTPATERVTLPPAPPVELMEGFNFKDGRFDGPGALAQASKLSAFFKKNKWFSVAYKNTTKGWGKNPDTEYYKVYLSHPTDNDLYTWFEPASEAEWKEPYDITTATWQEFVYDKK